MTSPSKENRGRSGARPPRDGVGETTRRFDVTLSGLRELRRRIDDKTLESDDWPLLDALVSKQIARAEAMQERMIAKMAASEANANTTAEQTGPVLDVEYTAHDAESTACPSQPTANTTCPGEPGPPAGGDDAADKRDSRKKAKGHGRNGAGAYSKAKHVFHALLNGVIGAVCAVCRIRDMGRIGTMYPYREKVIIHIVGQPLFAAEIHHYEQARCRECGHVIRADGPAHVHEGLGSDYVRYDWSACAMLMVMHYFGGSPFKRLESLHGGWGVPMSDANQWHLVDTGDDLLQPLYRALEQHAIQKATNFRMDDTGSVVVALEKKIAAEIAALRQIGESTKDVRTGVNATGFYWETPDGPVILFYTGRHHAGEMVDQLLSRRQLPSPKLVKCTDGASKNFDHQLADKVVEATCNAHAFLKFRAIKDKHPVEYAEAGSVYKQVFDNDDKAKALGLNAIDRMLFHRQHSKPLMERLKKFCEEKLKSKLVEPNSPLWEPLTFVVNQFERLTQFYKAPDVPLDTNLVEQALIIPVRYLAGSFNYKTEDGATVGDHVMSLIASAHANDVEPVAYLTECLRCHEDLAKRPDHYLPWTYRDRMKEGESPPGGARELPDTPAAAAPARPEPARAAESYATLRQRSGKAQFAGLPPQIRTCSSRASNGEQGLVPSPVGHAEKQPFDKRLVHSQNPDPS